MQKIQRWLSGKPERSSGPLPYKELDMAARRRMSSIGKEFRSLFHFMERYPRSVTFLGSARFPADNPFSIKARRLGQRIATELKYAVVTGGGPGIMESANRGAYEAGGESIGMKILLPHEQGSNQYQTGWLRFYYFFTRKVALSFSAECYIFFPGGFGTLDEFFEVLTLVQTHKIPKVPIILFGSEFWNPLDVHIKTQLVDKYHTVDNEDRSLYHITDNEDDVLDIIRRAPLRRE
jgi:uncharacterized protein (TIGR00730 family)